MQNAFEEHPSNVFGEPAFAKFVFGQVSFDESEIRRISTFRSSAYSSKKGTHQLTTYFLELYFQINGYLSVAGLGSHLPPLLSIHFSFVRTKAEEPKQLKLILL